MWGALASGLGGLLRTVAPTAINWGMNKLMNSGLGQKYIAPAASLLSQYASPSPQEQYMDKEQTSKINITP